MSKSKRGLSTLSRLVESDSEGDQLGGMPTPDSAAENRAPAKKARGRPKAAPGKITKAKAPARRSSGRLNPSQAKGPAVKNTKGMRPVLAEKTNQQYGSETEELDEFEVTQDDGMEDVDPEEPGRPGKQGKPKVTKDAKKPTAKQSKAAKETSTHTNYSIDDTPQAPMLEVRPMKAIKKGRPGKREPPQEPSAENIIPETQPQELDFDESVNEELEDIVKRPSRNTAIHGSNSATRHTSLPRRRAGSASDTERNDPTLRRRLGEITKKYDALNLKYQDLREIGLKEAERNFERLRKESEAKTNISNDLINSLKAGQAHQATVAKESKSLKKKVESQATEMAALRAQVAQLTASLSESQAEKKSLSAKLAANRTAAASVESANGKPPSSTAKASGGIRIMGTVETAEVAQAAQLKEDIYSDLSGLIIRSVKRGSEEDVFDCLQTGRNGTLHFKLAAANDKSTESYDDAQCTYLPQLDSSRDESLMELLPDYLVEEITFPRPQAAKFYARVVKALTEKPA